MTTQNLSSQDRRQILAEEYRAARARLVPNMGDRYSGAQIAAAKGVARKRALARIDALCKS